MRFPPKVEEPEPRDELPFPVETLRHWYVSPFGGRSGELAADQVGVNRAALMRNTKLEPKDRVTVGLVGTNPDRPWFLQERYEVVPLDGRNPEAAQMSPRGEVVLPRQQPFDFVRRPHLQPRLGDAVVLKGTAAKRIDEPKWLRELLGKSVRRPDF